MNKDCVSLEMAKELQREGFKECEYSWLEEYERGGGLSGSFVLVETSLYSQSLRAGQVLYPAPTTTELAEWLPKEIESKSGETYSLNINFADGRPRVVYENIYGYFAEEPPQMSDTLPDALAKMAVYLMDNALLPATKEKE